MPMRIRWLPTDWFYRNGELRETAREFLKEVLLEKCGRPEGTECWFFPRGPSNPEGYRRITWNGKNYMAHRLTYQIFSGPIPKGLRVLHSCDNPPCCNPTHLRVGTDADNAADKMRKGRYRGNGFKNRTHCPQGHPYDEQNTKVFDGRRYCRSCHRKYNVVWARGNQKTKNEYLREWRARKKQKTTA
jgi:hypothetical protein